MNTIMVRLGKKEFLYAILAVLVSLVALNYPLTDLWCFISKGVFNDSCIYNYRLEGYILILAAAVALLYLPFLAITAFLESRVFIAWKNFSLLSSPFLLVPLLVVIIDTSLSRGWYVSWSEIIVAAVFLIGFPIYYIISLALILYFWRKSLKRQH